MAAPAPPNPMPEEDLPSDSSKSIQTSASQKRKSPHDGIIGGQLGKHNLRPTKDTVLDNLKLDRPVKKARHAQSPNQVSQLASIQGSAGSAPLGQIIGSYLGRSSSRLSPEELEMLQVDNNFSKTKLADTTAVESERGLQLEGKDETTHGVSHVFDVDKNNHARRQSQVKEGIHEDIAMNEESSVDDSAASLDSMLDEENTGAHETPSTSYSSRIPKFRKLQQQGSQSADDEEPGNQEETVNESRPTLHIPIVPSVATKSRRQQNEGLSEVRNELAGEEDELLETINDAASYPPKALVPRPLIQTQTRPILPPSIIEALSPSSTSDDNACSSRSESMDAPSPLTLVKAPNIGGDTGIFNKMGALVFPKGLRKKKYDSPEYRRSAIITLDTASDVDAISKRFAHQLAKLGLLIVKVKETTKVRGIGGHLAMIEEGVRLTCEWQGRSKDYEFYLIESEDFELLWGHETLKQEGIYKRDSSGQLFIATGNKRKDMNKADKKACDEHLERQIQQAEQSEHVFEEADTELCPDYSAEAPDERGSEDGQEGVIDKEVTPAQQT